MPDKPILLSCLVKRQCITACIVGVAGSQDPASWLQPRLVLLDAGMVTHMSQLDQQHMLQLFRSFTQRDGQGVANAILHFSGRDWSTLAWCCCHLPCMKEGVCHLKLLFSVLSQ